MASRTVAREIQPQRWLRNEFQSQRKVAWASVSYLRWLRYLGLDLEEYGDHTLPNPRLPMGWNTELPTVAKEIQPLGSELFGEAVGLT